MATSGQVKESNISNVGSGNGIVPPGADDTKIVVVGDGAVGKTSLLISYTAGRFPKEYIPTVFDNYEFDKWIDEKQAHVRLWDTAGQEEYDHIRPLSYPDTDIFLVCFSVDSAASFQNLKSRWFPEIKENEPNAPCIVVGTKADLRENEERLKQLADNGKPILPVEEYKKVALELGAKMYIECSALTRDNLETVFEEAVKLARISKPAKVEDKKQPSKSGCCIIL